MKTTQTYKICDNLIGISELQDNSIDLTVTSPPYDNLRTYNGYSFDFETLTQGLYRVTKDGGVVVWIVGDATENGSESGTSFKQALFFIETGFNLHDTMIFMKSGFSAPSNNRYNQIFEYMFVFTKGCIKTVNLICDRLNTTAGLARDEPRGIKHGIVGLRTDRRKYITQKYGSRINVWQYPIGYNDTEKEKISSQHPAVFPDKLAKDHILSWSNEGDMVLDPFLGSGTTLKMCMETNRNGIGFEINEGYETIIKERLKVDTIKLDAWTT